MSSLLRGTSFKNKSLTKFDVFKSRVMFLLKLRNYKFDITGKLSFRFPESNGSEREHFFLKQKR